MPICGAGRARGACQLAAATDERSYVILVQRLSFRRRDRAEPYMAATSTSMGDHAPPRVEIPLSPPGHKLTAFLYEDVKNTEAFREDLLQSRIPELALVNPESVASTFHLAVAAATALHNSLQDALNVKSLHAELVYCLSPTCNISDSFRNFGSGKTDTMVLVAFFDTSEDDITKALAAIQGTPVNPAPFLDAPITGEKEARLRKAFKIGPAETHVENAVITRIAAKKYL